MRPIRIGTRGSALALWQARTVAALLEQTGADVEIAVIRTAGDRLQQAPLSEVGGKRLFVKEIEDALLGGEVDVAVHSAKDMSAVLPEGLDIAAVLPREDPRDALVLPGTHDGMDFDTALSRLPPTARVGTGSVRRVAQLLARLPRAHFVNVRGNVDTRLRKIDGGEYDALVLAAAGMRRLGLAARISAPIPIEVCVPAPGQGIVAMEIRAADDRSRAALRRAGDAAAAVALTAERAVVAALGGGCQLPLGAIAIHAAGALRLLGIVVSIDGRQIVRREVEGPASDPAGLGARLAASLEDGGALEILRALSSGGAQTAQHT